jgi:hypothetical protein
VTTLASLPPLVADKDVARGAHAIVDDQSYAPYVALPDTVSYTGMQAGKGVNWVPLGALITGVPGSAITSLPWSKITSTPTTLAGYGVTSVAWSVITGTPTTLNGYGITDGVTGTGTNNRVAKFTATRTVGDSSIVDDGTTVDLTAGRQTFHDATVGSAPGSGVELLQAYAGQLIARMQSEHLDYAVTPVNIAGSPTKAPKIGQKASQYTLTGPGTSTFNIATAFADQLMQANRSMYGLLLCTQRVEASATTGWAGLYLIEAHTDSSANIVTAAANITVIGTCGGASPTVTVQGNNDNSFTLSINNTLGGTITGMWQLLYGHCGT